MVSLLKKLKTYHNFDKILKVAAKGDLKEVQQLLASDPTLLNRPSEGHNRTLLWEAVNKNRWALVQYLVAAGADVNIPGRYRATHYVLLKPYCIAHQNKKEELKQYLGNNGHKLDIFSSCFLGDNSALSTLLKKDKSLVNQLQTIDKHWRVTPLHYALCGEQMETMEILLEAGAQVEPYSALLYEIASRKDRLDIIKLLTQYGGIPSDALVPSVFHTNNNAIINYFFKHGLDADKLFGMGWPPIAYLSRGDKGEHPEKIKLLVKYVKNINATTPNGVTAMHVAAKAGFISVLKVLLEAGAVINVQDKKGKTPLDYAVKYKRAKAIHFLKEQSAIKKR